MAAITIDQDLTYPNAVPDIKHDGYVKIPIPTDNLIINRNGDVIRMPYGKMLKQTTTKKGYKTISVITAKGRMPYLVHRLVAYLFIAVPLKHFEKDRNELQVNHKDGNKKNNSDLNLEWGTAKENMDHAYENGLLTSYVKRPVEARNILDNSILRFETIRECCSYFGLDKNMMFKHLNSVLGAGRIVYDSYVFKFDNGQEWPTLLASGQNESKMLWKTPDIIAKNVVNGKICLFFSLRQAAEQLGMSFRNLQNHRFRKGSDVPLDGWILHPIDSSFFQSKR